ncbi:hypothetical protein QWY85_17175 [Neolewinella lacunae]|uniref:Uncharacterized protein n=1 Tax=Neolewinella lacunae TaxID=1517758 RepID=A0A923T9U7_9BACT|nr:hypothetical protein [Neolewinella lacunae]MBC6995906.1 hypothetical protein [Neolewinella lacunae]MDN3636401.1 hypothetical protein [Neolewinella lacunae]
MSYSHKEHLHRFACWTAARAAQRGWGGGTTTTIIAALESTGFREKLSDIYQSSPTAAEFDQWHAERVGELTLILVDKLSKPQQNIYGRVAKIIAIYIKTVYVSQYPDAVLSKVAHPPIDGILLKEVKKKTHLKYPPKLGFHWSTFDAEAYQTALNYLREVNQGKAFWEIEEFWKATDAQNE